MQEFSKEEMMSDEEYEAVRQRLFGKYLAQKEEVDEVIDRPPYGFTLFSVSLARDGMLCVRSRSVEPDGAQACGGYSLKPADRGYEASVKSFAHLGIERGKKYVREREWEDGEWVVKRDGLFNFDV